MTELCCLRLAAMTSFGQASENIELMCGIQVSPSTIERTCDRNPISAVESEEAIEEISLDGGMVRLVTPKGQPSEWKEYKAVRLNGDGLCSAWFKDNPSLLLWTQRLVWTSIVYCLGDGHCGVWSLFAQMTGISQREEILDWFHLKENLHKVGGSLKRLNEAEALLWRGDVEAAIALFEGLQKDQARKFRNYLNEHRERIPNYDYYQSEGIPIGSGSVESLVKQIDQRLKIIGASWLPERVPQMLALRCAYINRKLDLHSLASG
jgi:hypothetical protein